MEELRLTSGGRERRAVLHPPAAGSPNSVILLLHGSGGSGEWALRETRWAERATDCLIVAPDATRPDPNLPLRFYTNPNVWNDGSGKPPADRVSNIDDVAFIRDLLDTLAKRWLLGSVPIFVTGFSNGAGMTFRLAQELADRITAIAPVAGHLPPSIGSLKRPVPTLYMIGTRDPLLPLDGGDVDTPWAKALNKPSVRETLARWAALLRLPTQPANISEETGIRREHWPDGQLEAWFIEGLGHHWPGGRGELNPRIAGPPSNTVDATTTIWQFFQSIIKS